MTKAFSLTIVLLLLSTTIVLSQAFKIKCDTVNFGFKDGPWLSVRSHLFDEHNIDRALGYDVTESFPMKKIGSHFEYSLAARKPGFIQIVNAEILVIPGQSLDAVLDDSEKSNWIIINDSNSINHFLTEFKKKASSIRVRLYKDIKTPDFLALYDSMKTLVNEQLKFILLPENRKRYDVDFGAISYLRQYFMTELGNFLFAPTWLRGDLDMSMYKIYKKDINISDATILLEFQMGNTYLQRHFFYYALPENNYDLVRTLNSDSIFRDIKIKKYLSYRYFSHLVDNKNILARISNFDTAFTVFRRTYTFSNDELLAIKKLQLRMNEKKSPMLSTIFKEDIIGPGSISITAKDKSQAFGGNKLVYMWASWCIPCREYLSTLRSNTFTYHGKPYTMIFVSIDAEMTKWKKASYPLFNISNNFKIANPRKSKFLDTYELGRSVPKVLLLQNGVLIESNLDKHLLIEN